MDKQELKDRQALLKEFRTLSKSELETRLIEIKESQEYFSTLYPELYLGTGTTPSEQYKVDSMIHDLLEKVIQEKSGKVIQEKSEEARQEELEKMYEEGKEERELKHFKENILKLSREEMKRDLGLEYLSIPELIDLRRHWEEFLVLHPETKTTQPELYNKLLIFCDVVEEFEIKERRASLGGLLTTGAGTGFKIAEVVTMILLAILGIAFVVKLVTVGLVDAIGYLILFAIGYFFYYFLGKDWKFKKRGKK